LQANPDVAPGLNERLREVTTDPAASLKERRDAMRFLRRHGFDDESLA
jgi:hypothetical protein